MPSGPDWPGINGPKPELRKIEADLGATDWLKDFVFALSSERGGTNGMLDTLIRDPQQIGNLAGASMMEDPEAKNAVWILWAFPTGWAFENKVRTNRFFDEMLARTDIARHRWYPERPIPSSPANLKEPGERFHYLMFRLMMPIFDQAENNCVHMAAIADEARLACVLERFHLAQGRFPNALTELVPEFISALPADLATGAPYHYKLTPKGRFILYSLGPNQRDDFGVIHPDLRAREQLDWVWCYPPDVR